MMFYAAIVYTTLKNQRGGIGYHDSTHSIIIKEFGGLIHSPAIVSEQAELFVFCLYTR